MKQDIQSEIDSLKENIKTLESKLKAAENLKTITCYQDSADHCVFGLSVSKNMIIRPRDGNSTHMTPSTAMELADWIKEKMKGE